MTDTELIHEFIDNSLKTLEELDLMKRPHPNMPKEMINETRTTDNDWIPWKAIPSKATDSDIKEIEERIGLSLPQSYIEFLKYKHFYSLDTPKEINFYQHCVRDWKKHLFDTYFHSWEPDEIIKKGFIPFGDYSDWGILCFDTNKQSEKNNEYEIIYIDHELLYEDNVPKKRLYPSFIDMIKDLRKEQDNLNQFNE